MRRRGSGLRDVKRLWICSVLGDSVAVVNHPMKSRFGKVCLSAVSTGFWLLLMVVVWGGKGGGGTLIESGREEDVVDVPF